MLYGAIVFLVLHLFKSSTNTDYDLSIGNAKIHITQEGTTSPRTKGVRLNCRFKRNFSR